LAFTFLSISKSSLCSESLFYPTLLLKSPSSFSLFSYFYFISKSLYALSLLDLSSTLSDGGYLPTSYFSVFSRFSLNKSVKLFSSSLDSYFF